MSAHDYTDLCQSPTRRRFYGLAARYVSALPETLAREWLMRHGLFSLAGHPALSPELTEWVTTRQGEIEALNRYQIWRFQDVVSALGAIPVCPLKGVHLLDTLYARELGSRPMIDIDILVPERDVEHAVSSLEATLGLSQTAGSARLAGVHHHRVLSDGNLTVEVHRRLSFRHGRRSSWADLQPAPGRCHGVPVHLLGGPETAVHLVTHFVRHGPFYVLKWVDDILRLASTSLCWSAVWRCAIRLGALPTVVAGLDALQRVLGEPVGPDELPGRDPIQRLAARANSRLIWSYLSHGDIDCGRHTSGMRRTLSGLLLAASPGEAVVVLAEKLLELSLRRGHVVDLGSGFR